jgi:hypothetical protein
MSNYVTVRCLALSRGQLGTEHTTKSFSSVSCATSGMVIVPLTSSSSPADPAYTPSDYVTGHDWIKRGL